MSFGHRFPLAFHLGERAGSQKELVNKFIDNVVKENPCDTRQQTMVRTRVQAPSAFSADENDFATHKKLEM